MGRRVNSHRAFPNVRSSFRRPVLRHFVSFAGNRSPNTRRCSRSFTESIRRKRWNSFYFNGRDIFGDRIFHKSCTLFCRAIFISSVDKFWEWSSNSTVRELHAEQKAINKIADKKKTCGEVCHVDLLLSYSPCARCADAIIAFKQASPLLEEIIIAFSAVYRHEEEEHRQGLQRLHSQPGVTLRVFNENDWSWLARETDMPLLFNSKRITEDSLWNSIFQMILTDSDESVSLEGSNPVHSSFPVLPPDTSLPSLEIHSSDPVLPFRTSKTVDPDGPIQPRDTFQPFQPVDLSRPVLPSSTSQPLQPVLPFSTSQLSQPLRTRRPALPPSASQPCHPVRANRPALPSSRSQSFQPALPSSTSQIFQPPHTRRPALPPSASQQFDPVRPNRPALLSNISQASHPALLPEVSSNSVHLPERDSFLPSGISQTLPSINPRQVVPPSRTFRSSSPILPSNSARPFSQICPSILCIHPDTENDPSTPWERFAKLTSSRKFIFTLVLVLFLVVLTTTLAVTL